MLVVKPHPQQPKIGKHRLELMWRQFLKSGTQHSAMAVTLPIIINRCVEEKVAFKLTGDPKAGYYIEPLNKENNNA